LPGRRLGREAIATAHADPRVAALAVRDQNDVGDARVDRSHGVLEVGDERAAAHLRVVHVARRMPRYSGTSLAVPRPVASTGVDVLDGQPRIGERVVRRLGVQHQRRLLGQLPDLVRFGRRRRSRSYRAVRGASLSPSISPLRGKRFDRSSRCETAAPRAQAGRKRGSVTSGGHVGPVDDHRHVAAHVGRIGLDADQVGHQARPFVELDHGEHVGRLEGRVLEAAIDDREGVQLAAPHSP
jgi:hypothetical protein